jgi:hypothetical protein
MTVRGLLVERQGLTTARQDAINPVGYSVSFNAFCFVPVWMLYRRRIFLKV